MRKMRVSHSSFYKFFGCLIDFKFLEDFMRRLIPAVGQKNKESFTARSYLVIFRYLYIAIL